MSDNTSPDVNPQAPHQLSQLPKPHKRWFWALVLGALALVIGGVMLLASVTGNYQSKTRSQSLEATISSDGKVVAVLKDIGHEDARIRIKWLERDEPWQEFPAPKYTNSIRFELSGYRLFLTHAAPGPQGASQLTRWDVSQPEKPSEPLFQGTRVAFPVEIRPGQVLVRMCEPPRDQPCPEGSSFLLWAVIENGQARPIRETKFKLITSYAQPNVTPQGFFWMLSNEFRTGHEILSPYAFALPGGKAPEPDMSRYAGGDIRILECDRKIQRCMGAYVTPESINKWTYVYGVKVFEGATGCVVPELTGYFDPLFLSPDGRFAVLSMAATAGEARRIAVLRFKPGQCEPVSIQQLGFKE